MKETREDEELVRQTLEGDEGAFEALVRKYEKPVYNAAYRLLGDAELARDVAQSAFLKVWENLGKFNPRRRFYSWMYRITINEAINARRKNRKIEPLEPDNRELVSGNPGPDEELAGVELNRQLQEGLGRMSEEYRIVIVLKHILGCSYEDISSITDVPVKTVKSRLFTARQLLRDHFIEKGIV